MVLTKTRKTAVSVHKPAVCPIVKKAEDVKRGDPARPGSSPITFSPARSLSREKIVFWTMGRTRTKSKNLRQVPAQTSNQSSSASSSTTPGVSALISKAQSIIEQCDYDLANQFIQRILQISPNNVEAREMLGIVQLETGLVQEARKVGSNIYIYFGF